MGFVYTSKKGWFLRMHKDLSRVAQLNILYKTNKNYAFAGYYFIQLTIFPLYFSPFFISKKLYEMRVVVKIYNYICIGKTSSSFFFFATCFINHDIELGTWLCSHGEREKDFQIQLRMKYMRNLRRC